MEGLSDARLLDVWERGRRPEPIGRALALLGGACPDLDAKSLARVDVFTRDLTLRTLRVATFGPRLPCLADCPGCGERMEFEVDDPAGAAPSLALESGASFRAPNSEDLAAVAAAGAGPEEGMRLLAGRCRAGASSQEPPALEAGLVDDTVVEDFERALAPLAEAAELRLDLRCVACGHRWAESLDVPGYLWDEVEERAERVLDDVHVLASWYGWTEREILALGEVRRRSYLERCQP